MMLDAVEFKLGAQELSRAWAEGCPGGPSWEWIPQKTAFASSKVGPRTDSRGGHLHHAL